MSLCYVYLSTLAGTAQNCSRSPVLKNSCACTVINELQSMRLRSTHGHLPAYVLCLRPLIVLALIGVNLVDCVQVCAWANLSSAHLYDNRAVTSFGCRYVYRVLLSLAACQVWKALYHASPFPRTIPTRFSWSDGYRISLLPLGSAKSLVLMVVQRVFVYFYGQRLPSPLERQRRCQALQHALESIELDFPSFVLDSI
jgi:hypothetical protein